MTFAAGAAPSKAERSVPPRSIQSSARMDIGIPQDVCAPSGEYEEHRRRGVEGMLGVESWRRPSGR